MVGDGFCDTALPGGRRKRRGPGPKIVEREADGQRMERGSREAQEQLRSFAAPVYDSDGEQVDTTIPAAKAVRAAAERICPSRSCCPRDHWSIRSRR